MSDYIKTKEYKFPDGETVTAYFDEYGIAKITIQAMDALFDILNSSDAVEVVRCKDCKYYVIHTLFGHTQGWCERLCDEFDKSLSHGTEVNDYCSHGERADTGGGSMSDYIKREDAKRAIRRNFHDLETRCFINNVINEVAKVSSDNLVEVVRCKDCKYDHKCSHNIIRPSKGGGVIYCPLEYCSEGERA